LGLTIDGDVTFAPKVGYPTRPG